MNSQITNNAISKIVMSIDSKTNYGSAILRKTGMVYSTVHNIIKKLRKENFIEFNRKGRVQYITFTNKGIKLKELLIELKQL